MKVLVAIASLAALSLGACSATTENSSRQELVDAGELSGERTDGGRVRCESVRVTGSRLSERICLTERQWDEMTENAQQARRDRDEQSTVTLRAPGSFGDANGGSSGPDA